MPTIQLHALEQIVKLPKTLDGIAEAISNAARPRFLEIVGACGQRHYVNVCKIVEIKDCNNGDCDIEYEHCGSVKIVQTGMTAAQMMKAIRNA